MFKQQRRVPNANADLRGSRRLYRISRHFARKMGWLALLSLAACTSGEGELFLSDLKGYYLSGSLTDSLIESADEGLNEITPAPKEWGEDLDLEELQNPDDDQEGSMPFA